MTIKTDILLKGMLAQVPNKKTTKTTCNSAYLYGHWCTCAKKCDKVKKNNYMYNKVSFFKYMFEKSKCF